MSELEYEIINNKIICSSVGLQAGVDEAGRGPVIGPMIMALFETRVENIPRLEELGVKDSKKLSPSIRKKIFNELINHENRIIVAKIPPKIIDEWVINGNGLNALEAHVTVEMIRKYNVCSDVIYVDVPSNVTSYKNYLARYIAESGIDDKNIRVDIKAEEKWVVVATASIIAKVIRDKEIENIKKIIGFDVGSGYPSDPRTKASLGILLREFPDFVRKSWKTVKKTIKSETNTTLDNFLQ